MSLSVKWKYTVILLVACRLHWHICNILFYHKKIHALLTLRWLLQHSDIFHRFQYAQYHRVLGKLFTPRLIWISKLSIVSHILFLKFFFNASCFLCIKTRRYVSLIIQELHNLAVFASEFGCQNCSCGKLNFFGLFPRVHNLMPSYTTSEFKKN